MPLSYSSVKQSKAANLQKISLVPNEKKVTFLYSCGLLFPKFVGTLVSCVLPPSSPLLPRLDATSINQQAPISVPIIYIRLNAADPYRVRFNVGSIKPCAYMRGVRILLRNISCPCAALISASGACWVRLLLVVHNSSSGSCELQPTELTRDEPSNVAAHRSLDKQQTDIRTFYASVAEGVSTGCVRQTADYRAL